VEFVNSFYTEAQERIVQCSIRDVTEKVRINNELARLDRLNVVGEMAASIAHEIRNPMTTVRGFLQLLGAKTEFVQHQHIMSLMIEELDRANNIITTYLSLARTSVDTTPCDLGGLVKSFAPILNADILMRDRNIKYELDSTTPISVCEPEIKQLLANLVKNACEAMSNGGTVIVAVTEDLGRVCLSVSDEGSGVAKELLRRLGTPFLTTKDNGVGLGLAICYRIAERHNATIHVDSSAQGSNFSICFPKGN
jgi:signal transduction histidine kinase